MQGHIKEHLVIEESLGADSITWGVERDSLKELWPAINTESDGIWMIVCAEPDNIEFPEDSLEEQKTFFVKTKDFVIEDERKIGITAVSNQSAAGCGAH